MIFAPPQKVEVRYRPSYQEIGDAEIYARYRDTNCALAHSRDGSEYLRSRMAAIEADHKLHRLSMLKPNWDTYGAEVPSADSINAARLIIDRSIGSGLLPTAILPSAEGGIAICFATQLKYADIECLNSGEILAVHYGQNDEPHAWVVGRNDNDAEIAIQDISDYLAA